MISLAPFGLDHVLTFGRYNGMTLREVIDSNGAYYLIEIIDRYKMAVDESVFKYMAAVSAQEVTHRGEENQTQKEIWNPFD